MTLKNKPASNLPFSRKKSLLDLFFLDLTLNIFRLNRHSIFRELFSRRFPSFFLAIGIGALSSVLEAISILALGPLIKTIHDGSPNLALMGIFVPVAAAFQVLAVLIPVKIGLNLVSKHLPTKIASGQNAAIRNRILHALIWSDARWTGRLNIADTIKRVDDGVYWTTTAFQHCVTILSSGLALGVLFLIMVKVSPMMSVFALVCFSLMHVLTKLINRNIAQTFSTISKNSSLFYSYICDVALAFPVIRTFSATRFFERGASEKIESLCNNEIRVSSSLRSLGYITEFFAFFFLLFNVYCLWSGWFTISFSAFMVFFYSAYRAIQSMKEITYELGELIKSRENADLVGALFKDSLSPIAGASGNFQPMKRQLEVRSLTYTYPGGKMVLSELDFTLFAGEKVAILGESGCGKSTLLSILMGMTQPSSGSIRVDGKEILPKSGLANLGLLIPQESHVFQMTVAENVAMSSEFDSRRVNEALQKVNLDSWLQGLPHGINTLIGEGRAGLSHGQKQRLAIARVLYRDFDILFLDEPNSALDPGNSFQVMSEIFTHFNDKTILMITHDDALLPYFDRILILSDGKLYTQSKDYTSNPTDPDPQKSTVPWISFQGRQFYTS